MDGCFEWAIVVGSVRFRGAEICDLLLMESAKACAIKSRIDATDKEIDRMVYELYGLTEEEVEMVEKG